MPDSSSARTRRKQADSDRLTWAASCTLLIRPSFWRALRINLSCLSSIVEESCVKGTVFGGKHHNLPNFVANTQANAAFRPVIWQFNKNDFRSGESHEDRCTQRD